MVCRLRFDFFLEMAALTGKRQFPIDDSSRVLFVPTVFGYSRRNCTAFWNNPLPSRGRWQLFRRNAFARSRVKAALKRVENCVSSNTFEKSNGHFYRSVFEKVRKSCVVPWKSWDFFFFFFLRTYTSISNFISRF